MDSCCLVGDQDGEVQLDRVHIALIFQEAQDPKKHKHKKFLINFANVECISIKGIAKWLALSKSWHVKSILVPSSPYKIYKELVIRKLRRDGFLNELQSL